MRLFITFLFSLLILTKASAMQSGNVGLQQSNSGWDFALIELKHRHADKLAQQLTGSEGGLIRAMACWDTDKNALILIGRSDKLQKYVTFIKTHVDVPYKGPGGRFGDNILSK